MGISQFPPAGGAGAASFDFVVDINDTTNNIADLGASFIAGAYSISLASGDTSFDIYLLDENGASVGYSNSSSIVATEAFETAVILGVANDEVITFEFIGAVANADNEGTAVGAGAYLTSISPSDLPNQDDTANIIGGNFATDVEIYFESGTVSTAAKQVARANSTALIVTRPDELDPALDPWDVKAINPGVTPPTGSNAHILPGTVDAGASPVWVTTSPLTAGTVNQAYSETLEATDADGSVSYAVTSGTLVAGLSLDSSTGVLSGTPSATQSDFTVTATDEGGNSNSREFAIPMQLATGGTVSFTDGYFTHIFDTSDDFVAETDIPAAEFLIVAGGGGGGGNGNGASGGGGAGGYLSSIDGETGAGGSAISSPISFTAGTIAVAVGGGGAAGNTDLQGSDGGDSFITGFGTAIGGGGGGSGQVNDTTGRSGGSGGGGGRNAAGGSGTAGQGFDGGQAASNNNTSGSGGGASEAGGIGSSTTPGISSSATGSSVEYSVGGAGVTLNSIGSVSNNAGSGGRGTEELGSSQTAGINGRVVIRYQ